LLKNLNRLETNESYNEPNIFIRKTKRGSFFLMILKNGSFTVIYFILKLGPLMVKCVDRLVGVVQNEGTEVNVAE
jgi:hypothetical protein